MPKSVYLGRIEKILKEVEEGGDQEDSENEQEVEICVGGGDLYKQERFCPSRMLLSLEPREAFEQTSTGKDSLSI